MNILNLEIENKVITCKFGILALKLYCEDQKIGLEDLADHLVKQNIFAIGDIIYFAYVANCNINGIPVELTKHQASEWLEHMDEEQIEDVNNAISEIKIFGKSMSDNSDKKK